MLQQIGIPCSHNNIYLGYDLVIPLKQQTSLASRVIFLVRGMQGRGVDLYQKIVIINLKDFKNIIREDISLQRYALKIV
jgi:hypothetical protein